MICRDVVIVFFFVTYKVTSKSRKPQILSHENDKRSQDCNKAKSNKDQRTKCLVGNISEIVQDNDMPPLNIMVDINCSTRHVVFVEDPSMKTERFLEQTVAAVTFAPNGNYFMVFIYVF